MSRAAAWCHVLADSFGSSGRGWMGGRTDRPTGLDLMRLRVPALAARMSGVEVRLADALDVIASAGADAVVYADPPYPTRVDPLYAADVDQAALDAVLLACPARVAVSGRPGERDLLEAAGWRRADKEVQVSLKHQDQTGRAVERVWTNYDPPGQQALI